ncbi:MAG: hypothetical protein QM638_01045 [Nocardioides sp.]|uniref:hypothetical protein n=1 Tax=Nocardioides sp. TaxID=35761 RepID=UPI0039E4269E
MTALSEYLAKHKGTDTIDSIAERARRAGFSIDRSTVSRYLAGKHAKRPPEVQLQALAAGLKLNISDLRELAGVPRGELGPWQPPAEANQLNRDQRVALEQLIKTIVREDGEQGAGSTPAIKMPAPGPANQPGTTPDLWDTTAGRKAARRTEGGKPSRGQQLRRAQDEAGEASQDPDDGGDG